jgi:capsular exopolysaccharide synthesis family protein
MLGLVPAVRGERVPLLSEPVPHDFGEAFRSLRTSLTFTSRAEGARVIAVTSSQPLEGKTTTACNLAMALALGGARVLLMDADMRRPGLHRVIGVDNEVGLTHLLVGQARVRAAVQQTREPNLFVITAGQIPPNPSELLASDRMRSLVSNLQSGPFDWVIIDTPPVLAVTDAVLVARMVSGVVFVIGSEMTRRVHAERAIEVLMSGRPKSIGSVLNRVDFERNKYYYSRYYGYHYQSYYGSSSSASA